MNNFLAILAFLWTLTQYPIGLCDEIRLENLKTQVAIELPRDVNATQWRPFKKLTDEIRRTFVTKIPLELSLLLHISRDPELSKVAASADFLLIELKAGTRFLAGSRAVANEMAVSAAKEFGFPNILFVSTESEGNTPPISRVLVASRREHGDLGVDLDCTLSLAYNPAESKFIWAIAPNSKSSKVPESE